MSIVPPPEIGAKGRGRWDALVVPGVRGTSGVRGGGGGGRGEVKIGG